MNVNERLIELLERYPAGIQPVSPLESLGGGGGFSGARLWRFRADHGDLLLRAWPPIGPGRDHVEQVHRWLSLMVKLEFIPVPIQDRAGETIQEWSDVIWEVTPWLVGSPDPLCPPSVEHLRLAFTALAAVHQRLVCQQVEGRSAGLVRRHREIGQLLGGGFDSLEKAIDRQSDTGAFLRAAATGWLVLARDVAPLLLEPLMRASRRVIRIQPVIRDARPEHFLFDKDRLSGLVDFGAMGVDSVAGDLARLIGEWLDGEPAARQEALASYERVRPLDSADTDLISVFEAGTALLIGERWLRWHFVENRRFDDPQAVSSGLERGLKHLTRLVREQAAWGRVL
jgi:Ser/Thr protein kinase RdoA (MazF antagonist)